MRNLEKLQSELQWWRTYGQFVSQYYRNVDDKACEYSNEIFELCLSGKFGLIAEYVAPVVVANLDQPETSGTQSL